MGADTVEAMSNGESTRAGNPAAGPMTLAIDCGGGGIKASVLDAAGTMHAQPIRVATPYPLPPERLIETVDSLRAKLPSADRITMGMPGMIRGGVVIQTPHYVTKSGPRSRVLPELVETWRGFAMEVALETRFGVPALVLNDAEVHGAGVIAGTGLELTLTFGTGLGSAHFNGGQLAPHLELSRAPVRRGVTYDSFIGEPERLRLGNGMWSRRVRHVVEVLRPVFLWDRVYLGGGNSRRITPAVLEKLGDDVVIVPNTAGIAGGVRAWELRRA